MGACLFKVTEIEILASENEAGCMIEGEASAIVNQHTTYLKEPTQVALESSLLLQVETISISKHCSDAVYTLMGELWLKKKRTLAIKHLKFH